MFGGDCRKHFAVDIAGNELTETFISEKPRAEDPSITVEPGVARTGFVDCNWLQIQENGNDPAHTAFMHVLMTGTQRGFSDEMGVLPVMQFEKTKSVRTTSRHAVSVITCGCE